MGARIVARQRMVKPEFFDSESLAECSIPARLAFIGLWVQSDDYGRIKAQYNRLKARIFPFDKMTVARFVGLLQELEAVGCIQGYEVDGEQYISIPNFSFYQYIKKPSGSLLPEYQEQYSTPLVPHQYPTSTVPVEPKRKEKNRKEMNRRPSKEGSKEKKGKREGERFAPPSIEEVREYVAEKGYTFDPEAFHAFYESKGWKVGSAPMKSWKAACTTWQKREAKEEGGEKSELRKLYGDIF